MNFTRGNNESGSGNSETNDLQKRVFNNQEAEEQSGVRKGGLHEPRYLSTPCERRQAQVADIKVFALNFQMKPNLK